MGRIKSLSMDASCTKEEVRRCSFEDLTRDRVMLPQRNSDIMGSTLRYMVVVRICACGQLWQDNTAEERLCVTVCDRPE